MIARYVLPITPDKFVVSRGQCPCHLLHKTMISLAVGFQGQGTMQYFYV